MTTPPGSPTEDDAAFVEIAPLYDMLMTGVPYTEWIVYLRKLLDERKARPRQVLDLACGTGNVSELLAGEGFAVTGVDIAPGMIAQARRKRQEQGLPIAYAVQDAACWICRASGSICACQPLRQPQLHHRSPPTCRWRWSAWPRT